MKKQLLLTLSGILLAFVGFSQNLIQNPSFELPKDSNNLATVKGDAGKSINKIKCGFNNLNGFYWRIDNNGIDSCTDSGREDSTKFGYDATGVKQAFDGNFVGYSYNMDPHIYQIVGTVWAGATYTLTAEAQISWPLADETDARIYLSVFSGTDTMKRTVVDSLSHMLDSANPAWEDLKMIYTFDANTTYAGQHLCVEFGNFLSTGASCWTYWDMFNLTRTGGSDNVKGTSLAEMQVYPNPSSDGRFNLKNVSQGTIAVYNVLGDLVYKNNLKSSNQLIDLSGQGKGVFIIKVQSDNVEKFQRVVIR
jgi:hypothetical protein